MNKQQFIAAMSQSWQQATALGLNVNKAVCFAQAALETGWLTDTLGAKYYNLFGMKVTKAWPGESVNLRTSEFYNGNWDEDVKDNFKVFPTFADCMHNYSQMINLNARYWTAPRKYLNNADGFLREIAKGGWATDPKYFDKVKARGLEIEKAGGPKWS